MGSLCQGQSAEPQFVCGYEEELLWKDAAYGPVLLADPASGIAPILHRSGVAETLEGPLGRLPKQNLDRTISTEGCPINDTRLQNAQGPSLIMLLPPSLDIAELHDSLCGGMHAIPGSHSAEECPESFLMAFPPAAIGPLVRLAGLLIISLLMAAQAHHRSHRPQFPDGVE